MGTKAKRRDTNHSEPTVADSISASFLGWAGGSAAVAEASEWSPIKTTKCWREMVLPFSRRAMGWARRWGQDNGEA